MSLIFTYQWTTEAFLCHVFHPFFHVCTCLQRQAGPSCMRDTLSHCSKMLSIMAWTIRSTPPSWGFLCWETQKMGYPWSKLDGLFLKGNPILKWNFMGTSNDSETSSFLAFCSLAMEVTAAKTLGFSKSEKQRSIWLNIEEKRFC